jgi:hypothetical protein
MNAVFLAFAIAAVVAIEGCAGGSSASSSTTITPSAAPASPPVALWVPRTTDTFQWQLAGTPDRSATASVYDVDAFETSAADVAALHAQGRHVVCYVNAGAYEGVRPDAASFPKSVIGLAYQGYPDEAWLDIRNIAALAPIMDARLDRCQAKGFDAVEPDNINGSENPTGFPLTAQDQIAYNTWFAGQTHARGMSIALKNDGDQSPPLLSSFDFVIAEECWSQKNCSAYAPFTNAKKAVFTVEYTETTTSAQFHQSVCPAAATAGVVAVLKHRNLDAYREVCP